MLGEIWVKPEAGCLEGAGQWGPGFRSQPRADLAFWPDHRGVGELLAEAQGQAVR